MTYTPKGVPAGSSAVSDSAALQQVAHWQCLCVKGEQRCSLLTAAARHCDASWTAVAMHRCIGQMKPKSQSCLCYGNRCKPAKQQLAVSHVTNAARWHTTPAVLTHCPMCQCNQSHCQRVTVWPTCQQLKYNAITVMIFVSSSQNACTGVIMRSERQRVDWQQKGANTLQAHSVLTS